MEIFGIGTRGLDAAERSLDFITRSTHLTSSNIANSETPGFKAKKLEFEKAMANALNQGAGKGMYPGGMAKTNPRHFPVTELSRIKPEISGTGTSENPDGNNVNLEKEMARLSELNIKYSAYTAIVGKELDKLKTAISLRVR